MESRTLAYKYRLILTDDQAAELDRRFAVVRKCWNFYREAWEGFDKEVKTSDRHKATRGAYTKWYNEPESEWMRGFPRRWQDYLTKDFDAGWKRWFEALKSGDVARAQAKYRANFEQKKAAGTAVKWSERRFESFYKPKFKSWRDGQSLRTDEKGGASVDLAAGLVKMDRKTDALRFRIKPNDKIFGYHIEKYTAFTFSRTPDGRYFIALGFTGIPLADYSATPGTVGIDMGCLDYAVTSDGLAYNMPDDKIKRLRKGIKADQEKLSRSWLLNHKREDWNKRNWNKLKRRIAKRNAKIAQIRAAATHQFTKTITDNYNVIGIEDLATGNMSRKSKAILGEDGKTFLPNKNKQKAGLNRSILSKNFFETRRQLEYKASWKGGRIVLADRYFASSQICSACGEKTKLELRDRQWVCPSCAVTHHRDENAAQNLYNLARQAQPQSPDIKQNAFAQAEEGETQGQVYSSSVPAQTCATGDRRALTARRHRKLRPRNLVYNGLRVTQVGV